MKNYLVFTLLIASIAFAETNETDDANTECVDDLTTEVNECEVEDDEQVLAYVEDLQDNDLSGYLVWGLGIALLNSVDSSSGTGTATVD
tara:strand:+ start:412 stop:678 length:267 start_codon:yes stop_codon:yes gene_type:complete